VLNALGAFVVAFRKPVDQSEFESIRSLLEEVGKVVKEGCGYSWDGVCLAVAMKQDVVPNHVVEAGDWEDMCQDTGFEFVDGEGKGRNEYGEPVGIARLKEALEANDWAGGEDDESPDDLDLEGESVWDENRGFGSEAAEIEAEMFGMKQAIYGVGEEDGNDGGEKAKEREEDQEDEVEQLEGLMLRMQAMRDMGADLPETERKRFAAKAVNDIMRTL